MEMGAPSNAQQVKNARFFTRSQWKRWCNWRWSLENSRSMQQRNDYPSQESQPRLLKVCSIAKAMCAHTMTERMRQIQWSTLPRKVCSAWSGMQMANYQPMTPMHWSNAWPTSRNLDEPCWITMNFEDGDHKWMMTFLRVRHWLARGSILKIETAISH